MNINLIKSCIVMESVADATSVDKYLLLEDEGFISLFKNLLNEGRADMQEMTNTLKTYVSNHY